MTLTLKRQQTTRHLDIMNMYLHIKMFQNRTLIRAAVFAGHRRVTDRPRRGIISRSSPHLRPSMPRVICVYQLVMWRLYRFSSGRRLKAWRQWRNTVSSTGSQVLAGRRLAVNSRVSAEMSTLVMSTICGRSLTSPHRYVSSMPSTRVHRVRQLSSPQLRAVSTRVLETEWFSAKCM